MAKVVKRAMAHVRIDAEGCKACLLCIDFCPNHSLAISEEMNSRGFHPVTQVDADRCNGCRICALMCPDCCIEVYREDKPQPDTSSAAGGTQ